jgi:hypothetical protein
MSAKILPRLKQLNAAIEARYFAVDDEEDGKKKKSGLKTAITAGALIGGGILAHKGIMSKFGTGKNGALAPVGEAYKNAGRFAADKLGAGAAAAKTAIGRGITSGQGAGEIIKRGISGAFKAAKNKVVPATSLNAKVLRGLRELNADIEATYFAADDDEKKKKWGLGKKIAVGAAVGAGALGLAGAAGYAGSTAKTISDLKKHPKLADRLARNGMSGNAVKAGSRAASRNAQSGAGIATSYKRGILASIRHSAKSIVVD